MLDYLFTIVNMETRPYIRHGGEMKQLARQNTSNLFCSYYCNMQYLYIEQ